MQKKSFTIGITVFLLFFLSSCGSYYQCGFFYQSAEEIQYFHKFDFDAFDFQKGEVIAGVGASNGWLEFAAGYYYDSLQLTFYIEDIDSLCLCEEKVSEVYQYYQNLKQDSLQSNFYAILGTTQTTNLPENTFDKVILYMVFHHFDEESMPLMMQDLYKILKPEGTLFICEGVTHARGTAQCDQGFDLWSKAEIQQTIESYDFVLTKTFDSRDDPEYTGNSTDEVFHIFAFKKKP